VRRQSALGVLVLTLFLVWPLVVLVGRPVVLAYNQRQLDNAERQTGDFTEPSLQMLAAAIAASDSTTLTQLLKDQPPPAGQDRAGNDLLAYALVMLRDKEGGLAPVRVLLEAGADPRRARIADTLDVVNFIIRGHSPAGTEALRLLLEHGADPNAVDPETGKTPIAGVYMQPAMIRVLVEHGADIDRVQPNGVPPIVDLIATQDWESALYLIERGARLDLQNADGLSVDYYLASWKESVFGEHPEGWDKVRAAIAGRRAPSPSR
jgi:ankyrin repeat protein